MWLQKIQIKKVVESQTSNQQEQLVIEKRVVLSVNGRVIKRFNTIPTNEKALGLGYLAIHYGIVNMADVTTIFQEGEALEIDVPELMLEGASSDLKAGEVTEKLKSSVMMGDKGDKTDNQDSFTPTHIYQLTAYFQEKSMLYRSTAISESAALVSPSGIVTFSEDIDSENALYKCIGLAIVDGLIPAHYGVLITSKLDVNTIENAIRLGITTLMSRTGVTAQALELAKANGIKLYGFCRGRRINVYN